MLLFALISYLLKTPQAFAFIVATCQMQQGCMFNMCKNSAQPGSVTDYTELPTERSGSEGWPQVSRLWAKGIGRETGCFIRKAAQVVRWFNSTAFLARKTLQANE